MAEHQTSLIPAERIELAILFLSGQKVDFMFQLIKEELENWRSQSVTSNPAAKMALSGRP